MYLLTEEPTHLPQYLIFCVEFSPSGEFASAVGIPALKLWQEIEFSPLVHKSEKIVSKILFIFAGVRNFPVGKQKTGMSGFAYPPFNCKVFRRTMAATGQHPDSGKLNKSKKQPSFCLVLGRLICTRIELSFLNNTCDHSKVDVGSKLLSLFGRISPILALVKKQREQAVQTVCFAPSDHFAVAILWPKSLNKGRDIDLLVFGEGFSRKFKFSAPFRINSTIFNFMGSRLGRPFSACANLMEDT